MDKDGVKLLGRTIIGHVLTGLVAIAVAGGCARPASKTAPAIATATATEVASSQISQATVTESRSPVATSAPPIDRGSPVALLPITLATARPTPALDRTAPGIGLQLVDQLGGDVRLLGDDDRGDLLASIGARMQSFLAADFGSAPLASSPLLPGLPTGFARSGNTAVLATSMGLSVLFLEDGVIDLAANIALGPVTAVAMQGDLALALVSRNSDESGQRWYPDGSALMIVDVSRSAEPKVITVVGLPESATDIAVHEDTAFVVSSGGDLIMVDLTDPQRPGIVSSGPWPWIEEGQKHSLRGVTVEDDYMLVKLLANDDARDEACLYVFELSRDSTPTFLQSHTCPFGQVQWAHVVGRTIVLRRDERVEVLRIGEPEERKSLDEIFGESKRFSMALTSSARIDNDVVFAPISTFGFQAWMNALRVTVFRDGDVTANTLWGQTRSVNQFQGVAVEGGSVVTIAHDGSCCNPPELRWMRLGEGGLLEPARFGLEHRVDQLRLSGSTLYAVDGDHVDTYMMEEGDQPLRHLGVLEPRLPSCMFEEADLAPGTPCASEAESLSIHGPIMMVYRAGASGDDSAPGPLAYDLSDPRRPEIVGMVPGNRLSVSATTDGRNLGERISVAYLNGLTLDEQPASAAVAWHAGRAYLAYLSRRNCRGGCPSEFAGRLEVRDPRLSLDQPPVASLDLPESLAKLVQIEVEGVPHLLIARGGPTPGLYDISLKEPETPRLVGFFGLPAPPVDLTASGSRVYIADGSAGLIVLEATSASSK